MARIENTNLPLAAKGTNSVGVSLIRVLLCFLQGQKLFIHIVPGNIVNFWNSDFLKETQTFWKSHHWTFLLHEFFFLAFTLAWIFFWFFPHPPPPPITFLMVCPLLSLFEEPASSLEVVSSKNLRKYDHSTEMLSSDISEWVILLVASNVF